MTRGERAAAWFGALTAGGLIAWALWPKAEPTPTSPTPTSLPTLPPNTEPGRADTYGRLVGLWVFQNPHPAWLTVRDSGTVTTIDFTGTIYGIDAGISPGQYVYGYDSQEQEIGANARFLGWYPYTEAGVAQAEADGAATVRAYNTSHDRTVTGYDFACYLYDVQIGGWAGRVFSREPRLLAGDGSWWQVGSPGYAMA